MVCRLMTIVALGLALLCHSDMQASLIRSFPDIAARSPSQRYEFKTQSPDNRDGSGKRFWQSNFTLTCTDTSTGKILWTSKQAEDEGLPTALFVSDSGWTVIRTHLDDIVCVDRDGAARGTVKLIKDALIGSEFDEYVHRTTAGYSWSGYSLWYFLEAKGGNLFVIRPWWGRSIVVDVPAGGLAKVSPVITKTIDVYEREYVVTELAKGVKNRAAWEKEFAGREARPVLIAAYLAGVLHVNDAIPDLLKLQDSSYVGSSSSLLDLDEFEDEVDPHSYSTLEMRQVVHLSLRRLGKSPGPLPIHVFSRKYKKGERTKTYEPKPLAEARHMTADSVRKGMKADEVLDLIGAPDFVRYGTWEYDMDAEPAYSLIVKWDRRSVVGTEKRGPALWQQGMVRDRQFAE